jgi:hypothetical protein
MTFDDILDQTIEMLQRRGRLTYRTLKRQFQRFLTTLCRVLSLPVERPNPALFPRKRADTGAGRVLDLDVMAYNSNLNSYRLTNKPMTISCSRMDLEKQIVLRARRLIRVRFIRPTDDHCHIARRQGVQQGLMV